MARSTNDTLFGGQVALAQPARGEGYRVNVDALLLASFARRARPEKTVFDLGAGVGAITLALLHWEAALHATLVESDPVAATLARENLQANEWKERGDVVEGDVGTVARSHRGEARLVVCNPPYFAPGRGNEATGPARQRARSGELGAFVEAARALLGHRGRACFVYPARELTTLVGTLRSSGLEPKRLRAVRATASDPARVVLVEAMPAKPGGLVLETDLIERSGADYSREMGQIISGDVSGVTHAHGRVVREPQDRS